MNAVDYILELSHVTKAFPGVTALEDIDMKIVRGSVHVLVGENGAGKSTLMKIINGIYTPDNGAILFNGKPYSVSSPTQARSSGVSMIFQELNIVPEMTVAENIFLGREPRTKTGLFVDDKKLNSLAAAYMKDQGLEFSPSEKMKNLSVSQAQMIEIIKAISCNAKLIIMDEPTSAITDKEVDYLFEQIEKLKRQGVTIIYISHKMEEIFRISDFISVFRDGKHIDCRPAKEFDRDTLIAKMVGRDLSTGYPKTEVDLGPEVLRVEHFSRGKRFRDVSFAVRRGEILGVSGLMGAGRTEVVRAIFGLDPKDGGEVFLDGKPVRIQCVDDAIRFGLVMVSEDRRKYGIIPMRNVKENIGLVGLKYHFGNWWIRDSREKATVQELIDRLEIKTPNQEMTVSNLSGGNQQKVILAKWLMVNPRVLILDEPTRGIDIGAKYEIYKLMCELCERGMAIVMISSELPELIGMSDRILVMADGAITGQFARDEATQIEIMKKATGGVGHV